MQHESVSQKSDVPPASATHRSSIASNKRPPAVINAASGGKYHRPGTSTTFDEGTSKWYSPEKTRTVTGFDRTSGESSTSKPYAPEFATSLRKAASDSS